MLNILFFINLLISRNKLLFYMRFIIIIFLEDDQFYFIEENILEQ